MTQSLLERLEAAEPHCNHHANAGLCHEAAALIRQMDDLLVETRLSERIAVLEEKLEQCALGFEKHARHWRASQARTDSLEDGVRARNADALAAEARAKASPD